MITNPFTHSGWITNPTEQGNCGGMCNSRASFTISLEYMGLTPSGFLRYSRISSNQYSSDHNAFFAIFHDYLLQKYNNSWKNE